MSVPQILLVQEDPIPLHLQQRYSFTLVETLVRHYTEAQIPTLNFMELVMVIAKVTIPSFMEAN